VKQPSFKPKVKSEGGTDDERNRPTKKTQKVNCKNETNKNEYPLKTFPFTIIPGPHIS